jgi:hypothetical protein
MDNNYLFLLENFGRHIWSVDIRTFSWHSRLSIILMQFIRFVDLDNFFITLQFLNIVSCNDLSVACHICFKSMYYWSLQWFPETVHVTLLQLSVLLCWPTAK